MARNDCLFPSVIDAIGSTPPVELHRLRAALRLRGRLLAKLECLNPGLSKKDLIAREMILEAHREGHLAPGQPVIERTSVNTGTGLGMAVTSRLGHAGQAGQAGAGADVKRCVTHSFSSGVADLPEEVYGDLLVMRKGPPGMFGGKT